MSLAEIERQHLRLLLLVTAGAFATGWLSPWGILLGGGIMGANFWLMRHLFTYLRAPRRTELVVLLGVAKQMILIGLFALLFWRVRIDALAVAVGVTLLLVVCVVTALRVRGAPQVSEGW